MLASLDTGETIAVVSLFVGMVGTIAGVVWKLQKFVRDNAVSPKNCETQIKLQNSKSKAIEDCVENAIESFAVQIKTVNTRMGEMGENLNQRHDELREDMKDGFKGIGERIKCMEQKLLAKK